MGAGSHRGYGRGEDERRARIARARSLLGPSFFLFALTLTGSMSGNPFLAINVPTAATTTNATSPMRRCTFRDRDSFDPLAPPSFPC